MGVRKRAYTAKSCDYPALCGICALTNTVAIVCNACSMRFTQSEWFKIFDVSARNFRFSLSFFLFDQYKIKLIQDFKSTTHGSHLLCGQNIYANLVCALGHRFASNANYNIVVSNHVPYHETKLDGCVSNIQYEIVRGVASRAAENVWSFENCARTSWINVYL